MRLSVLKTSAAVHFYIIKSTYNNGRRSTKIVEKIGTEKELLKRFPGRDPRDVAQERVDELNRLEADNKHEVMAKFSNSKLLPRDKQQSFQGGYLFLQKIYSKLGLRRLCKEISKDYKFDFDLSNILSSLLYTRILDPGSKRSSLDVAKSYLEPPSFELHDLYRALEVLAKENDRIQAFVYKESKKLVKRNDKILFYDLTNYFFEIEQERGMCRYGYSKDHKPNPIVQMGLFLDGSGMPLAFSLNPGNTSEQVTLKPLEKKILQDFELSEFVTCTDAGLSSTENRIFNNRSGRAFVTTQSLKKMKAHLRDWALDPEGWELPGVRQKFSLLELKEEDPRELERTYYKTRWIKEDGLEQKLVVSFSLKYKNYKRSLREAQLVRAEKKLENPSSLKRKRANDPARFIKDYPVTEEGELASDTLYALDLQGIEEEARYDGFYAVCTNLEAKPSEILFVNKQRWQIEAAFRTLKSEFKARPVYLQRDDRILAHFMTCFLALLMFNILEKKLHKIDKETATEREILDGLRKFNFYLLDGEGYIPTYTRTALTDALHEIFGFRTDYQILTLKDMKKIIACTKR